MKPKINNTRLFRQVADVIGEHNAIAELGIVRKALKSKMGINLNFNRNLSAAFSAKYTPQGLDFWRAIMRGEKPGARNESVNKKSNS